MGSIALYGGIGILGLAALVYAGVSIYKYVQKRRAEQEAQKLETIKQKIETVTDLFPRLSVDDEDLNSYKKSVSNYKNNLIGYSMMKIEAEKLVFRTIQKNSTCELLKDRALPEWHLIEKSFTLDKLAQLIYKMRGREIREGREFVPSLLLKPKSDP